MTVIFFGSSEFSLSALESCLAPPHRVLLVITTPDQKKGRGLRESPSPVRDFCDKHKIPVEAPASLKQTDLTEKVRSLKPELFVVSSYGKIIPPAWLTIPASLAVNVHPSLLPKYRGAAPIHWTVLNGEKEAGVTIAELTETLDAGDIFHQIRVPIDPAVDSETLSRRLAELSGPALASVFHQIETGTLKRLRQEESLTSYARKLKKEDGIIDWREPATAIANRVRGLLPWPVATTYFQGEILQILKARVAEVACAEGRPGQILEIQKGGALRVQTGQGALFMDEVKPAGKKIMTGAAYAGGRRLQPGALFESAPSSRTPTP